MQLSSRSAIAFPLALLLFLALLTSWINRTVQLPAPKPDGSSRHDPDYIMSNFLTTQTDVLGDLHYKLAAIEMRHFPDNDTTELQRPRYTQFTVNKPYTQAEGLRGYVSADGEEVQLVDNVKITRQAFAGKGEMTVETDYLNIRPNEELVTTQSPVIIRQAPKTVIYATGMIYEKKNQTVTLQHRVRAHYEKPVGSASQARPAQAKIAGSDGSKLKQPKSGSSKNTKGSKKLNTEPVTTKQEKSNTNNVRIRRRYE
jgi:lipopolysaccharide export system protein LptC